MKYINKECKTADEDIICYQCGYIILKYDDDSDEQAIERINNISIKKYFFDKDEIVILCDEKCLKDFENENKDNYDKNNELYIEKYFRVIYKSHPNNICTIRDRKFFEIVEVHCHNVKNLFKFLIEEKSSSENVLFISTKRHTYKEINTFASYEDDFCSLCYDDYKRIICVYCNKLIDLDYDFYDDKDYNPQIFSPYGSFNFYYCDNKCMEEWMKEDEENRNKEEEF